MIVDIDYSDKEIWQANNIGYYLDNLVRELEEFKEHYEAIGLNLPYYLNLALQESTAFVTQHNPLR